MLDPQDCVVLFADLQPPIVANSGTASAKWMETGASALAQVATLLGIPILFSVVPENGGPPHAIPGLEEYMRPEITYVRQCGRPFRDERYVAALAGTGRRSLVIAGYASEAATLFAALDGIDAGFAVTVALDAGGGASARTEDAAMRRIERAGGVVTANVDIFMSWVPDFTTAQGIAVFDIMQTMIAART